jgi:hypothetical protein
VTVEVEIEVEAEVEAEVGLHRKENLLEVAVVQN